MPDAAADAALTLGNVPATTMPRPAFGAVFPRLRSAARRCGARRCNAGSSAQDRTDRGRSRNRGRGQGGARTSRVPRTPGTPETAPRDARRTQPVIVRTQRVPGRPFDVAGPVTVELDPASDSAQCPRRRSLHAGGGHCGGVDSGPSNVRSICLPISAPLRLSACAFWKNSTSCSLPAFWASAI
jgi:hypothetical protein